MKKTLIVLLLLVLPLLVAEQAWSCRCINGVPYRCDAYGNCVVDYDTCGYICTGTNLPDTDTGGTDTDGPDVDGGGTDTGGTDIDTGGTGCPRSEIDKQFLLDKYDIWVQTEEVGTQPPQAAGEVVEQKTAEERKSDCEVLKNIVFDYLNPLRFKEQRNKVLTQKRQAAAGGKVDNTVLPSQPTYFEAMDALAKLMSDCPSKAKIKQEIEKRFHKDKIEVVLTFQDDAIVETLGREASAGSTEGKVVTIIVDSPSQDSGSTMGLSSNPILSPPEGTTYVYVGIEEEADKAKTAADGKVTADEDIVTGGQETAIEVSPVKIEQQVEQLDAITELAPPRPHSPESDPNGDRPSNNYDVDSEELRKELAHCQKQLEEVREDKARTAEELAKAEKNYAEQDKNFVNNADSDLNGAVEKYKKAINDISRLNRNLSTWRDEEARLVKKVAQLQEQGGIGNND